MVSSLCPRDLPGTASELALTRRAGAARAFGTKAALAVWGVGAFTAVAFGPIAAAIRAKRTFRTGRVGAATAVAFYTLVTVRAKRAFAIVFGRGG